MWQVRHLLKSDGSDVQKTQRDGSFSGMVQKVTTLEFHFGPSSEWMVCTSLSSMDSTQLYGTDVGAKVQSSSALLHLTRANE